MMFAYPPSRAHNVTIELAKLPEPSNRLNSPEETTDGTGWAIL